MLEGRKKDHGLISYSFLNMRLVFFGFSELGANLICKFLERGYDSCLIPLCSDMITDLMIDVFLSGRVTAV